MPFQEPTIPSNERKKEELKAVGRKDQQYATVSVLVPQMYKQRGGGLTPPLRRGIRKADTFEKYRDVISRSNLVLILFLMQVSLKSINMDKQSLYLFGTPFLRVIA
jgi:hypothetical protein